MSIYGHIDIIDEVLHFRNTCSTHINVQWRSLFSVAAAPPDLVEMLGRCCKKAERLLASRVEAAAECLAVRYWVYLALLQRQKVQRGGKTRNEPE